KKHIYCHKKQGYVLKLYITDKDKAQLNIRLISGYGHQYRHNGSRCSIYDAAILGTEHRENIICSEIQYKTGDATQKINCQQPLAIEQIFKNTPCYIEQNHIKEQVKEAFVHKHVGNERPRTIEHALCC